MDVDKINEKLNIIGMRERCLELTQELATVKERAEAAEDRVKELELLRDSIRAHFDEFDMMESHEFEDLEYDAEEEAKEQGR